MSARMCPGDTALPKDQQQEEVTFQTYDAAVVAWCVACEATEEYEFWDCWKGPVREYGRKWYLELRVHEDQCWAITP